MVELDQVNSRTIYGLEKSNSAKIKQFLTHQFSVDLASVLKNRSINHLGGLLYGDVNEIAAWLEERGYTITDSFPSTIIARELSDKYNKDIPIHIYLCKKEDRLYEYFIISPDNLDLDEMQEEWGKILHIAYKFDANEEEIIHIQNLVKHMVTEWFSLGYCWTNANQNQWNWATTLYFVKELGVNFQLKIEIIVDGLHDDLIDTIKKDMPQK